MAKKQRADHLLHDLGLAESRERAKRLIMAGQVLLVTDGREEPVAKPGQQLPDPLPEGMGLRLKEAERFVSRGAYKLLTAIEAFGLDLGGKVLLDGGASTGGFTDCALQHGAAKVYAVDVGKGQLHEKLRADERVINLENVNLRLAEPDLIPEPVDLATFDVSFISLTKVLGPSLAFLKPQGQILALIKPQFELSRAEVGKGVVRDEALRQKAIDKVTDFSTGQLGLRVLGLVPSSILGPKGNQEYLLWLGPCLPDNDTGTQAS